MPPELDPAAAEGLKPLTRRNLAADARRERAEGIRVLAEMKTRGHGYLLTTDHSLNVAAAALFAAYYTVDDLDDKPEHFADCLEEARHLRETLVELELFTSRLDASVNSLRKWDGRRQAPLLLRRRVARAAPHAATPARSAPRSALQADQAKTTQNLTRSR